MGARLLNQHGLMTDGPRWTWIGKIAGKHRWTRTDDASWTFGVNTNKTRLGVCKYKHFRIEVSTHHIASATVEQITDTILHEIAHAIAGPGAGHGVHWFVQARKIGCNGKRCGTMVKPEPNFIGTCNACGAQLKRYRRATTGIMRHVKPSGLKCGVIEWARVRKGIPYTLASVAPTSLVAQS